MSFSQSTQVINSSGPFQCSIVIPIFNEEKVITNTVDRLKAITQKVSNWDFEIICINDGSSDNSGKVLDGISGIRVIHHDVNRGYGAALRTGLDSSTREWVFICDADATYPIEDLPLLTEKVAKGGDMVVGARNGIGITMSPFRRLARWTLRKMAHALSGVMVPDLNSGMRIFKRSIYREFRSLLPMGFSFTTTITLACLYSGYRVIYVPINYDRRVGKSNIKPVKDFFAFTMLILRIATYFEPMRFFLPLAFFIMGMGLIKGTVDFVRLGSLGGFAIIAFLLGVQIFVTGVLADVIVRRSNSALK